MDRETEEAIAKVLSDHHMGGLPHSYTVYHTADRVMLVFGVLPGEHRDVLRDLISRQTDNQWQEDAQISKVTGAKFAIGSPDAITSLKERLLQAGIRISPDSTFMRKS